MPAAAPATPVDGFETTWSEFRSASIVQPTVPGDDRSWRRGRDRYFAWVVPVDDAAVLNRFEEGRAALAPWLLSPWLRRPHVTVFVAGFARRRAILDDDVSFGQLKAQSDVIRHAVRASRRVLVAGALNSFRSAPFIEIHCPDSWLASTRRALGQVAREQRFCAYQPHVTVGVYNAAYATRTLSQVLFPHRIAAPLEFDAGSVDLVSYDAADVAGELRLEERITLQRGR